MAIYERGRQMIEVVAVLAVPSYLTVALRCYVRIKRGTFGKDDWCILAAAACMAWFTYEMIAGAIAGVGALDVHFATNPLRMIPALRHLFLEEISFAFAVLFIKLAISFMLLRVANKPIHLHIINAVAGFYVLITLAIVFYVLAECSPIQANWDPRLVKTGAGHCGPVEVVTKLTYALIIVNILTDWFFVVMPAVVLWDLQMNKNTKIGTASLLSLGIFTSGCSIVRLAYTPGFSNPEDHLYRSAIILVWGYAETGVGMITTNCAVLRPLFRSVFGRSESSYNREQTPGYPSSGGRSSRAGRLHFASPYSMPSLKGDRTQAATTFIGETDNDIHLQNVQRVKNSSIGDDDASDKNILAEQKEAQYRYFAQA